MAEREWVIDEHIIQYEGLFSVKQLYKLIQDWLEEKGYDQKEVHHNEKVTPAGKFIELEIKPWKKVTDYAKNVIHMKFFMENIKEVEIEQDGMKVNLNQGSLLIETEVYIETDYEGRWEMKPTFFLIRSMFDKYFYKPFTQGFRRGAKTDFADLATRIKSYLNLYRYKYVQP